MSWPIEGLELFHTLSVILVSRRENLFPSSFLVYDHDHFSRIERVPNDTSSSIFLIVNGVSNLIIKRMFSPRSELPIRFGSFAKKVHRSSYPRSPDASLRR